MQRRRDLWVVSAIFFVSGAAGLIYQVVWSRMLSDVFGVSIHAITAVLATYLGGLALGGWALGPVADRNRDALRVYGWLELGIAAAALAGNGAIRLLDPVHAWAAARLAPASPTLLLLRILLAAVVVLPPTLLMGATLPAITRALVQRIGNLGRGLSLLYGLNTAGAVVGSVAAGFMLIRALGVHGTLWIAVAVNCAAGVAALAVAAVRRRGAGTEPSGAAAPQAAAPPVAAPAGTDRGLLVVMMLSGIASLCLEVIWTRMLSVLVGTSTYAFVTMLSTFLVGIALGSLIARGFVDRLRNPRRTLGWIQVAIAASTLATIPLTRWVLEYGKRWFADGEPGWTTALSGRFLLSFLIMIVPTTLIGTTLPIAAVIWARSVDTLGRRLGQLYGANTLGNVAGAAIGGFVVLPLLGMQKGIALVATFNLFGAGWGLAHEVKRSPWRTRLLRVAPVAACLCSSVVLLWAWHPEPLPASGGDALDPVLFYQEGPVSTVKVFRRARDGRQLVMAVDGITIGQSSAGVDKKQQVLAHLPFMLSRKTPEHVLSIGLGTGILVGEVARHPGVANVECVELSPSVIEAAREFAPWNGGALERQSIRVVNDDGVNYLKRSAARYDAIISDGKSRSGHAGNALFYSSDYYRSALDHLAADGTMIQWVPLDVEPDDLKTIVRTFTSVFPHAYMWLGEGSSFLVGTKQALTLDMAHVQRVLDAPETEDLRRYGWRRATDVASLLVADTGSLRAWVSDGSTTNSLERPILEFYPPGALTGPDGERVAANLSEIARLRRSGVREVALVGADAAELDASSRAVGDLVDGLVGDARGTPGAQGLLWRALAEAPDFGVVHQIVGQAIFAHALGLDVRKDFENAIVLYRAALEASPMLVEATVNLGRVLALRGRTDDATAALREALAEDPSFGAAHAILGDILQAEGMPGEASGHYERALQLSPKDAGLRDRFAVSLAMLGRTGDAVAQLRSAVEIDPDLAAPKQHLALLLATDPTYRDPPEAVRLARSAVKETGESDPGSLETLAAAYAATGDFDDAVEEEEKAVAVLGASGSPAMSGARAALEGYRRHVPLPGMVRPPPATR
ncbi:fused MFS/spermidine synthase [Anaeromyxobacter terrae]|uniref:fused MFS/spermidine synthase n=1 Tax=Anaeromyxobacter terrae TaxID=2925406 RepID=UPI001F576667|nr:fused MFS/spermidine synthase [Anaeromyxobacter sp. SG22]